MEYIIHNGELYHHGIKGMRWGIRRYQAKDGSLTPAGKKRYNREMEKLKAREKIVKNKEATRAKLAKMEALKKNIEDREDALNPKKQKLTRSKGKKSSAEVAATNKPKTVKDLSDAELTAVVNRLRLEQQYAYLQPQKVSKGQKFVKAVLPIVSDTGKKLATDYAMKKGKEWLGLDKKDESLEKIVKDLETKEKYKKLIDGPSEHDRLKEQVETLGYKKRLEEYEKN